MKKWKTQATCFSFQYLFPDAVDKSADGSEARTNTSPGSIPPPDSEDSVSSNAYVKNVPDFNYFYSNEKQISQAWLGWLFIMLCLKKTTGYIKTKFYNLEYNLQFCGWVQYCFTDSFHLSLYVESLHPVQICSFRQSDIQTGSLSLYDQLLSWRSQRGCTSLAGICLGNAL